MKKSPEDSLWDAIQVADYLGVSARTVHAYRRRHGLPTITFGAKNRTLRFDPAEVKAWARNRSCGGRDDESDS